MRLTEKRVQNLYAYYFRCFENSVRARELIFRIVANLPGDVCVCVCCTHFKFEANLLTTLHCSIYGDLRKIADGAMAIS